MLHLLRSVYGRRHGVGTDVSTRLSHFVCAGVVSIQHRLSVVPCTGSYSISTAALDIVTCSVNIPSGLQLPPFLVVHIYYMNLNKELHAPVSVAVAAAAAAAAAAALRTYFRYLKISRRWCLRYAESACVQYPT